MKYVILEKDYQDLWSVIYQGDDLIVTLNEARQYSYTYPDADIKVLDVSITGIAFE